MFCRQLSLHRGGCYVHYPLLLVPYIRASEHALEESELDRHSHAHQLHLLCRRQVRRASQLLWSDDAVFQQALVDALEDALRDMDIP